MEDGDRIHLVETEEGFLITPYDPDFEDAMEVYEEGAKDYRNALRALSEQYSLCPAMDTPRWLP